MKRSIAILCLSIVVIALVFWLTSFEPSKSPMIETHETVPPSAQSVPLLAPKNSVKSAPESLLLPGIGLLERLREQREQLIERLGDGIMAVCSVEYPDALFKPFNSALLEPFYRKWSERSKGVSSSVLIDAEGRFIAPWHPFRPSGRVMAVGSKGEAVTAKLLGTDAASDLALWICQDKTERIPRWAEPAPWRRGERVFVIWREPAGDLAASEALISGSVADSVLPREFFSEDLLKLSILGEIPPAGAAVAGMDRRLIGITAYSKNHNNGENPCLAIPISVLRFVTGELLTKGTVGRSRVGWITQTLSASLATGFGMEKPMGALVVQVEPDGAAARAGLLPGDIVVAFNEDEVKGNKTLSSLACLVPPGQSVPVTFLRKGKKKTVSLIPEAYSLKPFEDADATASNNGITTPKTSETNDNKTLSFRGMLIREELDPEKKEGVIVEIADVGKRPLAASRPLRAGARLLELAGRPIGNLKDFQLAAQSVDGQNIVQLKVAIDSDSMFICLWNTE